MAIKVAVAQMNSMAGDVEGNLAKVAALMRSRLSIQIAWRREFLEWAMFSV